MVGVIEVAFDPVARLGPIIVRWQTLGVALAILCALVVATVLVGRAPAGERRRPLRLDDLLYVVLGAVPGAVIGGRLLHGLVYWDHYRANPAGLLDPSVGSLSLLGAVLGGILTGSYIAGLLGGSARRWAGVAAVPLLVAIALGKVAQFLGGGGQGASFAGDWAVAFAGPGPWLSPAAGVPAHPSQLYEAAWTLLGVVFVPAFARGSRRRLRGRPGRWTPGLLRRARETKPTVRLSGGDAVGVPAGRTDVAMAVGRWRRARERWRTRPLREDSGGSAPDAETSADIVADQPTADGAARSGAPGQRRSEALQARLVDVAARFAALRTQESGQAPPLTDEAVRPARASDLPAERGDAVPAAARALDAEAVDSRAPTADAAGRPAPSVSDDAADPTRGRSLLTAAVAWWLVGRVLVGFTWADDRVVGPLAMEQAAALVALGGIAAWSAVRSALPFSRPVPATS